MVCRQCKADRVHRSHRAGLKERAASLLGFYPYQCLACGDRRRLRPGTEKAGAIGPEVVRTLRRIEWVRTRREILLYGISLLAFAVLLYFMTRQRMSAGDGG
jgi:hypothetical protein